MSAFLFPSLSDSLNLNYKKHEDHEWNIKDKLKNLVTFLKIFNI